LRSQQNIKNRHLFNRIQVTVTGELGQKVSLRDVIDTVEKTIPKHLTRDIETVYIGSYKPLEDRKVDSMYVGGSILISDKLDNNKVFFNTFVHEIAHSVEELAAEHIYGDGELGMEFLSKRKTLYMMLKDDYKLDKKAFFNVNYSQELDLFFAEEIGYDNLRPLVANLFLSPYAVTSLREYFANAFEHMFVNVESEVKQISPVAFKKIKAILKPNLFK
jgi:hypothetical protein